jgi:hypothetical protein
MKLLSIESSRIIYLMQFHRPDGQLYLPDAVEKLVKRYSFVKAPSPDQALPYTFTIGKFKNAQIAELSIYNDGFIVSSASDTDLVDEFIDDFLSWAIKEFGIIPLTAIKPEKFYESSIVVKSEVDLAATLKPQTEISNVLADAMKSAQITAPITLSGFILDFNPKDFLGKRKPFRVIVDRRVNVPFSENIFYSQSPFRTRDHLKVLTSLERTAKPSKITRRILPRTN